MFNDDTILPVDAMMSEEDMSQLSVPRFLGFSMKETCDFDEANAFATGEMTNFRYDYGPAEYNGILTIALFVTILDLPGVLRILRGKATLLQNSDDQSPLLKALENVINWLETPSPDHMVDGSNQPFPVPGRILDGARCEKCEKEFEKNSCFAGYREDLKACPGCESAFYCSRECQKADWRRHKKDHKKKQHRITTQPVRVVYMISGEAAVNMKTMLDFAFNAGTFANFQHAETSTLG